MKKIWLMILAGFLFVTSSYASTYEIRQDTLKCDNLWVTGSYNLGGQGGAGWADSLRDSSGVTHPANDYARRNTPETIQSLRTFQEGIRLYGGEDISDYLWMGSDGYMAWYYNYPNDFWINKNLRVTGDTVEVNYLKVTETNLPGMTIYSGDSVYEDSCRFTAGTNITFTKTANQITIAAASTASSAQADSLKDFATSTFFPADSFLLLGRVTNAVTGTVTFSIPPVFPAGTKVDSADYTDTSAFAWGANDAESLGAESASKYARSDVQDTITAPIYRFTGTDFYFDGDIEATDINASGNYVGLGSFSTFGNTQFTTDTLIWTGETLFANGYIKLTDGTKHNLTSSSAAYAESAGVACIAWVSFWDSTKGMPAGFADGIDNVGGAGGNDTALFLYCSAGDTYRAGDDFAVKSIAQTFGGYCTFTNGLAASQPISAQNIVASGYITATGDLATYGNATLGNNFPTDHNYVTVQGSLQVLGNLVVNPGGAYPKGAGGYGNITAAGNLQVDGNITTSGTVDGYDVGTMGAKLATVETNAKDDQTITAGAGMTGGGTGDVTLNVAADAGSGINVLADKIEVDKADLDGDGLIVSGTELACDWGLISVGGAGKVVQANDPSLSDFLTQTEGDARYTRPGQNTTITADWWNFDHILSVDGITTLGDDATLDSTVNKGKLKVYNDVMISGVEIHPGQSPYVAWSTGAGKGAGSGNLLVRNDIQSLAGVFIDSVRTKDIRVTGAPHIYTEGSGIDIVGNEIKVQPEGITAAHILNGTIMTNDINSSAGIVKTQISNAGTWEVVEIPQNAIISSSGTVDLTALNPGIVFPVYSDFTQAGAAAGDTAATLPVYQETATSAKTKVKIVFCKVAAMKKLYFKCQARAVYVSSPHTCYVFVYINGSSYGAGSTASNSWVPISSTGDISSLTDGTVYEMRIKMYDSLLGETAQMRNVTVYMGSE